MSAWLFNVCMDGVMKEMGMGRRGVKFLEDGRERRDMHSLLYADDLVICGESEEVKGRWWDSLLKCV